MILDKAKKKSVCQLTKIASLIILTASTSSAFAGAFSLFGEANGRNSGDFASGAAADAEDASTLFYNPAGLAFLRGKQLVLSSTLVKAKSTLSNDSYTYLVDPAETKSAAGVSTNETAVLPSFFYSKNISDKLTWAVGMYAPFGLSTDWGNSAETRYAATLSKLEIINVSPALGVKICDRLFFGAAFDIQLGAVDFNSVGGASGAPEFDSISTNTGKSVGFGGHLGFIYQMNPSTRIGLNYQSSIKHEFHGTSTLNGPLASSSLTPTVVSSNGLSSDPISMPAQITLSALHEANEKLTFTGTLAFTQWSVFQNISLNGVVGQLGEIMEKPVIVSENFRNTWRVVGGVKYKVSEKSSVRMGLGFDQTPTNNVDRSIRLPDSDRVALAAGGHYQATKSIGLDFGWTHLFVKNTRVDNTTVSGSNNIYVNAGVKTAVDLLGAQMTWQIS